MMANSSAKTALPADAADAPVSVSEDDDLFSLDFTKPEKLAKTTVPQPVQTAASLTLEPLEDALPAVAPSPPAESFPLVRLDPATEAAALAYSAGDLAEARRTLETALQTGTAGEAHWLMLFEVYRAIGDQAAFDRLALEYVNTMEKSAPAWHNDRPAARTPLVRPADGRASVALNGSLNARCAPQFAKLMSVTKTRSLLRLDLGRIQDADNGGCALLLGFIQYLKKTACELELDGMAYLKDMLKAGIVAGQPENDAIWLLLLELHQQLGEADAFETLALEYAVTFEVSPPSWELPKPKRKNAGAGTTTGSAGGGSAGLAGTQAGAEVPAAATLHFSGDLLNAGEADFAALKSTATGERVIDLFALKRMDQTSAMSLRRVLSALPQDHAGVRLIGCNHLLAAMLEMAGIGQLARIRIERAHR
ncbi:hypothetical protein [Sterolibacterium denitrificans]|nr:hypothetical protein [Sterolibacterium denitrificans]